MDYTLFNKSFDDENHPTKTSDAKIENEASVKVLHHPNKEFYFGDHIQFLLNLKDHVNYKRQQQEFAIVTNCFYYLVFYDVFHLTDSENFEKIKDQLVTFMSHHINKSQVFSGFIFEVPHVIINLHSITAIAIIGNEESYQLINKKKMYEFLMSLKSPDGSFFTNISGENDIRSTYAALAIAYTLNILTPELVENTLEFTKQCFNFDGGFSPLPGLESHGGYVHCGIGILYILNALDEIDLHKVLRFISMRQDEFSGGFNGRTNKLPDSCYSWWIGTAARIVSDHLHIPPFWNVNAMSQFLVQVSQIHSGGFCDCPPKNADLFHTCYGSAGLHISGDPTIINEKLTEMNYLIPCSNEKFNKMRNYFSSQCL